MNKEQFKAKMEKEFHNGRFIEIHSGDYETILGWFKDNPVPSLNTQTISFQVNITGNEEKALEIITQDINTSFIERKDVTVEFIKDSVKLQNGVETNKEQPKYCDIVELVWGMLKVKYQTNDTIQKIKGLMR